MKRSQTRIRPMSCPECGYHTYGTRSWWERGFPVCPCGGTIIPDRPADLAWAGLIGPADMSQKQWNDIARENGWDVVRNHGQAARRATPSVLHAPATHAEFCAYPGCGRWVAAGAEACSAGHPQHEHVTELAAAVPF